VIPARRSWILDETDEGRLQVFVPGAMGAGILLSVGLLLSDAYRRVGGRRLAERRVALTARATATDVVFGPGTSLQSPVGMRGPVVYVVVSAAALGLVALLVPGATWNYFNPSGYIRSIAWIWAASGLAVIYFAMVGFTVASAVPRSLPLIVGAIGLGVTFRFTQLADGIVWVLMVGPGSLTATIAAVYIAHRYARNLKGLPARAWPLFVSTPLTREVSVGQQRR
jgi:hypothetical protein